MKNLSIMIKPASALCNLRCKYCFYANVASLREVRSFGVMTRETMHAMLKNIREGLSAGDHIQFAFQGGEPTLAGLDYFREFSDIVRTWRPEIQVDFALQTNGILLDESWAEYLHAENYLVGLSLDLLPECHDGFRVDPEGQGTYRRVVGAMKLLKEHREEFNVLCTLTSQAARHPQQIWNQLKKLEIQYVQFTPCLDELEKPGESPYALTPKRFAEFYDRIFSLWYADYQADKYRSIKLIDDVVNLMLYGMPTSCGMNGFCQPQMVAEADGSMYPCDFYCLEEYCTGNLARQPLQEILDSEAAKRFQRRPHQMPEACKGCPFRRFCGGNCKRMQREICCSGTDTFCGYRTFLEAHLQEFQQICTEQQRLRRAGGNL